MPTVYFRGEAIVADEGENLREVLLRAGKSPYNGKARLANCRGFGSCGTCAVEIEEDVGELSIMERWRLGFPPHEHSAGLRLACQIEVHQDLHLTKHPGFWGHKTDGVG